MARRGNTHVKQMVVSNYGVLAIHFLSIDLAIWSVLIYDYVVDATPTQPTQTIVILATIVWVYLSRRFLFPLVGNSPWARRIPIRRSLSLTITTVPAILFAIAFMTSLYRGPTGFGVATAIFFTVVPLVIVLNALAAPR